MISNFGFFGKGVVTHAPPATSAAPKGQASKEGPGVISPISPITPIPKQAQAPQAPKAAPADSEHTLIRDRLTLLKQRVEAQQALKQAHVQAIQARHAKQAAYGRDVVQKRPPKAGYATEAEKIMGGSTGYYTAPGFGYYGSVKTLAEDVDIATDDVAKALAAVKQISKDVETGIAPKSDLERAMKDLQIKAKRAEKLSKSAKGLSGFGESKTNPFWILAIIGVIAFLTMRPR